ncbi:ABC transporter permease [Paenibacillus sp. J23TS9]|uniref:carbohydrate ABC transporter permease n=1 Tax=Paenibacillus sp. J23TS9 TaxID=2807193 RepID=UPI001B1EC03E|nr:carbohydrate ABC transporter permease [Paenibacillus sp. J23TS9]GIP27913.1 ABC transporter permease [Paenibacillus sp. J23TS9]
MVRSQTASAKIWYAALIFVMLFIALSSIAPIIHTVAVSFSNKAYAAAGSVMFWPKGFNLFAYKQIMADSKFSHSFMVSLERVLLGGAINFLMTTLMAYPLSRSSEQFTGRNAYMWFLVFTMLFSGGIIPLYILVKSLGLFDSIWALVLPSAVPIFNVILLMNFFRSIPKELNEAGSMDGAGPWYMLFQVYIPLSMPSIATVTLFSIVGHWNSFFDGMIFMRSVEHYPLQTYIQQLVVQMSISTMSSDPNKYELMRQLSNQTLNAAKIVVAVIPVLVVYPFLQKYFIQGILLGSVKE